MKDAARRTVLDAYQAMKKTEVIHPLLNQSVPYGLLPLLQARLLAKTLRQELETYPPFLLK